MTSPVTTAREQPQNTVGDVPAKPTTQSELPDEDADLEADDGLGTRQLALIART